MSALDEHGHQEFGRAALAHAISQLTRVERPTPQLVMLRFAELVATRSTCVRNRVGAVVTDQHMLQVLGYGYNGNARGLPNHCDSPREGACGCVHAEENALLKAPGIQAGKLLFTSVAPCAHCAKRIINAFVSRVYFRKPYRDTTGVATLMAGGVDVVWIGDDDHPMTIGSDVMLDALRSHVESKRA